jgi:hypothetical protein
VKKDEEEETVEQVVRTGCERARREIRAEEKNLTLILLCIRVRIGLARLPDCLWGAEGDRARVAAATCVTPHDPSRPLHSTEEGRSATKAHSFGLMLRTCTDQQVVGSFLRFITGRRRDDDGARVT